MATVTEQFVAALERMTEEQAEAELKTVIAAVFPYARPEDDPDQLRARGQIRALAALSVLARPTVVPPLHKFRS